MATPVTTCQFENSTSITFKLDSQMFWHGTGIPPQTVGASARFTHTGDEDGSIGGILYTLGDQAYAKWIVAWSTKSGSTENQVYTTILGGKEPVIWEDIRYKLVTSKGQSEYSAHGYKSITKIDLGTNFPNLTASFSKAPASSS